MKSILIFTLSLFICQPVQEEDKLQGIWKLPNNVEIQMVKDGDIYTGTVVRADIEKAVGKILLRDFKKYGDVWKGKFYVARKDRLLDATLTLKRDDSLEVELDAGRKKNKLNLSRTE